MRKRRFRSLTAILLAMLMLVSLTPGVMAEENGATRGIVSVSYDSYLNVRSGPGVNYSIVGRLEPDEWVTVLGMESDSEGVTWYQVTSDSGVTGYVHSEYIYIEGDEGIDTPTDMEFEAYLEEQGFPESYRTRLRRLHEQYPNWIFVAQHTGLDWNTVIAEESVLGRNLVYYTVADSWKSYEEGAYNPVTKSWTGYDGESWVCASTDVIAYFMDPRNFLDSTSIFQFEELSYNPDAHAIEGVESIIEGSFMEDRVFTAYDGNTYTFAEAIMEAAEYSGVSPFYIASRVLMEQGSSGSPLSSGTYAGYEGIYNFFNIGAYTANGYGPITNGFRYAASSGSYLRPWDDQLKALQGGALFLAEDYIQYGQDTMYLHKFDVVDGGDGYYSHQYMTSVQAPSAEAVAFKAAYTEEMLNAALVFKIPVYENMPEQAVSRPTNAENGNDLLDGISVDGRSAEGFYAFTTEYILQIDPSVTTANVQAWTNDASATVSGTGTVTVPENGGTISLTVTASNGDTRTYTIHVEKVEGATGDFGANDGGDPYPVLSWNSEGAAVSKLQSWLNELGYNCGAVDGVFGWGTHAAVVAFQEDHNLTADGVVGASTWSALLQAMEEGSKEVDITDIETLTEGASGDLVTTAQDLLTALGYTVGETGVYDAAMTAAVQSFQQDQGLTVNGTVDRPTWHALYTENGYQVIDNTPEDPEEPADPEEPETPEEPVDVSGFPEIYAGTLQTEYVIRLQERLNALGYDVGTVDGIFGNGTRNAVIAFQNAEGLVADGIVGQATWKALYEGVTEPADPEEPEEPETPEEPTDPEEPETPEEPEEPTDPGESVDVSGFPEIYQGSQQTEYVIRLQERLNALGYDAGTVDGIFGYGTRNAVIAFQRAKGLVADGIVGQATWKALYEGVTEPADPEEPEEPETPEEPEEPTDPGESVDVSGFPEIYQGSQQTAYVRRLQERLNALGYDAGTVDGIFGYGTRNAVIAFQRAKGLVADGIVGQATWKALYEGTTDSSEPSEPSDSENTTDVSNFPELYQGSTQTSYVRQLQTWLNQLGYDCGTVDGEFGYNTRQSVINFQTDAGLVADGIVGQATWKMLAQSVG